jgi:beta-xylosidase
MQDILSAGRGTFETVTRDGIGHLTRVLGTHPAVAADGAERLAIAQRKVAGASRLGIPAIAHEECLTGFTTLGATVYPTSLAWAATFNPGLIEEMAAAIGTDMRSVGVHQGLSPVLDVVRDYRWGRVEETMGEDPYLVSTLGTAYVRGLESTGVVATLKHFAGYAASRGGRNHAPVSMGPRELADMILPPFEMAVRVGGARSVMNSYTDIDGVPVAANHAMLTTLLRGKWGFTGTVVSDYWAIAFLKSKHLVAETVLDAAVLALKAGLDVELPNTTAYGLLEEAL